MILELKLYRRHPDFCELYLEEFEKWVTYGLVLGHFMRREPLSAIKEEIQWLNTQPEPGAQTAKHMAAWMLNPLDYPLIPYTK